MASMPHFSLDLLIIILPDHSLTRMCTCAGFETSVIIIIIIALWKFVLNNKPFGFNQFNNYYACILAGTQNFTLTEFNSL